MNEHKYQYKLSKGEALTRFLHSDVVLKAVNSPKEIIDAQVGMVEGYFDVEYPVRKYFLATRLDLEIAYNPLEMKHVYSAFEGESVNLSAFISTPHHLTCWAQTFIQTDKAGVFNFKLKTCGGIRIWINGILQVSFDPFSRNDPKSYDIELDLVEGANQITIYFDDLAERDTTYFFELKYQDDRTLQGFIPLAYEVEKLIEAEAYLTRLYPERDCFKRGEINIINPGTSRNVEWITTLMIRFNPENLSTDDDMQDGNITEFKMDDLEISATGEFLSLGLVSDFKAAGLTKCELSIYLPDGSYVRRVLTFIVYDEAKFEYLIKGKTLAERKKEALNYFLTLDLDDVNVALIKLILDHPLQIDKLTGQYQDFATIFPLIEAKGDCADFVLAPMLAVLIKYPEKFPQDLQARIKELSLHFRYWIDEPGNDVMWYFSENHALLFHVAQYLAGYLYPEDEFSQSVRLGDVTKEIGYQRLIQWFADFFKYGFSEWNSITYLPIDLIGFFSLYLAAPDVKIKQLAKKAIDITFELTAIHLHHGAISSTYGRVYEHNLKTTPLGEMTNLAKIAWGNGYFNNALRASALFVISDYEPDCNLENYVNLAFNKALIAEYIQGINRVQIYQYKTRDYSLSSAINYRAYGPGYQQHMMNISLGRNNTQFWINHPGEKKFSGEGRPSYWAGNGIMPLTYQYKNVMMLHYLLTQDLPFIHMYFPSWEFDEIYQAKNWLFLLKDDAYVGIYFSCGYQMTEHGAVAEREIKSIGCEHFVVVKCSSDIESSNFKTFIEKMISHDPTTTRHNFKYVDHQYGSFEIKEKAFYLNDETVSYHAEYDKKITIETRV